MARGSQRDGAGPKARGPGAAFASKRRSAPGAPLTEAAPGPGDDSTDSTVAALRTEEGRERAYARLFELARDGGQTRDAVSGLTLAKHVVDRFAKADKDREVPERLKDLQAEIAELKAALGGAKGGSSLRADAAVVPLLVTNEQHADLGASEDDRRSGEPLPS